MEIFLWYRCVLIHSVIKAHSIVELYDLCLAPLYVISGFVKEVLGFIQTSRIALTLFSLPTLQDCCQEFFQATS